MSTKIHLADYYPLIQETLDQGRSVTLTVTGTSMFPFLLGNRDRVTLSPITGALKKNDLPLYRRSDGSFVLHRIVKVEKNGTYTCCGDHQWQLEPGLLREQMIAIATEYERKGKHLTNRNIWYRMYRTFWTWVLKYRWIYFGLRSRAARLFKKKKD